MCSLERGRGQETLYSARLGLPGVVLFSVLEAPATSSVSQPGLQPFRVAEANALMVEGGYLTDPLAKGSGIDRDSRQGRMHVAQSEYRHGLTMWRGRSDQLGDASQGDRVAEESPRGFVVGMPHPSDPGVSPGEQP